MFESVLNGLFLVILASRALCATRLRLVIRALAVRSLLIRCHLFGGFWFCLQVVSLLRYSGCARVAV